MAQIIGLPKLSPTMEEGILIRWVKKEGDAVEPGDLIAEVETDKANMDFNLEDEGVLLKLLVAEGETVRLGAPVAILGEAGEDISDLVEAATQQISGAASPTPAPAPDAPPAPATPPASTASAMFTALSEPGGAQPATPRRSGPILASPLAKSRAIELGIDLRQLTGTGPGGRIIERDVRAAASTDSGAQIFLAATATNPGIPIGQFSDDDDVPTSIYPIASSPRPPDPSTALAISTPRTISAPASPTDYVDKPLTGMRKTIAKRLTEAKRDVPHFRITSSVDAEPLIVFRRRLNDLLQGRGKVTVNDLIVKGAALALRRVPDVNAAFVGDAIRYFTRVHIGVAVALDRGLITPVVRDADLKGLGVIGTEVRDLVTRAKNRQVKTEEITGSTLTVSNLGMFRVDHFDAIINPPEAAILAVGRIAKIPVVDDDELRIGQRMSLTLSCDHRVVDGALGARYLDELVAILEQPESLVL